jgi:hypothetical protein
VTIFHLPPGNPDNAHTITVGAPAVPVQLAHGATLGPCPQALSAAADTTDVSSPGRGNGHGNGNGGENGKAKGKTK